MPSAFLFWFQSFISLSESSFTETLSQKWYQDSLKKGTKEVKIFCFFAVGAPEDRSIFLNSFPRIFCKNFIFLKSSCVCLLFKKILWLSLLIIVQMTTVVKDSVQKLCENVLTSFLTCFRKVSKSNGCRPQFVSNFADEWYPYTKILQKKKKINFWWHFDTHNFNCFWIILTRFFAKS